MNDKVAPVSEGAAEAGGWVGGDKVYLKGARPVPGPTMMIGVDKDLGSLKSGFLATYTPTWSPTCTATGWMSCGTCAQTAGQVCLAHAATLLQDALVEDA